MRRGCREGWRTSHPLLGVPRLPGVRRGDGCDWLLSTSAIWIWNERTEGEQQCEDEYAVCMRESGRRCLSLVRLFVSHNFQVAMGCGSSKVGVPTPKAAASPPPQPVRLPPSRPRTARRMRCNERGPHAPQADRSNRIRSIHKPTAVGRCVEPNPMSKIRATLGEHSTPQCIHAMSTPIVCYAARHRAMGCQSISTSSNWTCSVARLRGNEDDLDQTHRYIYRHVPCTRSSSRVLRPSPFLC
jgi:hypothetical protein